MNASRGPLSLGRAALNDSSHRRLGAAGLASRAAAAALDQLGRDEPLGAGSGAPSATTIATTLSVLISSDVTQAYDNTQQDSRWPAGSLNGSALAAHAHELIVAPNLVDQQQQQLQLELDQQQQQQSFSDWWQEYWSRQPFPSGYTQSSITMVACLLTTIIFLIVVGNLLVCIAIFTEKSLKPTQNWFIASLAVSDMLLGLVVMPFSLARELMGFWIFGPLWCDIHEALDVLLTTASINTLCLISLDRYWSITQAVNYLKKRTPRRAVFMIAFVWVFSAAVSLPPLFGWKKQSPVVTAPALGSSNSGSSAHQNNATRNAKELLLLQKQRQAPSEKRPQRPKLIDIDDDDDDEDEGYANEGQALVAKQESLRSGGDRIEPDAEADDLGGKVVGEQSQWQRKRRRRRKAGSESSTIPDLMQAGVAASLHRPVINYAYLASKPAPQLEQQPATNEYPTCQLSDDIGYVLYSALGSFFIPCAVMVFTYIKIGLAARKRARRAINKQARAHQQGGLAGGKRGAAGGLQRRTIAGTTSGRASKQHPVGDSALLLTPALANLASADANDSQILDETTDQDNQMMISKQQQRRNNSVAGATSGHNHHHRNSRAGHHAASGSQSNQSRDQCASTTPLMMGKLVVVERQKASHPASAVRAIATTIPSAATKKDEAGSQVVATATTTSPASLAECAVLDEHDESLACCATATLVTSGSKLASPSALKYSTSCEGISSVGPKQEQQTSRAARTDKAGQHRKPTSESNDSSLITVMSASMSELPQVTRFKFAPVAPSNTQTQTKPKVVVAPVEQAHKTDPETEGAGLACVQPETAAPAEDGSSADGQDEEKQRAAALLKAISLAGRELANDQTLADEPSLVPNPPVERLHHDKTRDNSMPTSKRDRQDERSQQQQSNNSTNETCFMTIEEDSDNLDAQTGRTIMMIASTAKQSTCSLANKSQVGMMMTMMPAAPGTPSGGNSELSTIVCNNVACLRRQARRQANRRQNSSYCGSSMTINGDEDEEEEDDDDDEDDDEEAEDDEDVDEDDLLANSIDDEDDECLEDDDLLTDDCNGYSGSCRLDPYCTGTASSTCTHCRECAALSGRAPLSADCTQDSPLSCAYKYSKSTLQDSPQMHSQTCNQANASGERQSRNNKRSSKRFACQRHNSTPSHNQQQHHHHHHHQLHGGCNISETEAQSLTGDDNLSLTDYYRSNEDNSSVVGHDVLDATPAREHLGPKRRSIVASAIASVGGGLNRMASSAAAASVAGQQSSQQQQRDQQQQQMIAAANRKKSSIGFHLTRFGSGSGSGPTATSPLPPTSGGLLALAAASQQQQAGANAPRNLKTLRQNFFHKLNQLTAKSAAKQDSHNKLTSRGRSPIGGKSSVHSSYGSSYEPSIDCATTSNIHSTNDQYHAETTLDDYEQQTSAETTKQSSDQISSSGAGVSQHSPVAKLVSMATQQASAANTRQNNPGRLVVNAKDVNHNQRSTKTTSVNDQNQRFLAHTTRNLADTTGNKRMQLMSTTDDEPNLLAQSSSQISLTTDGGDTGNQHAPNSNDRQLIGSGKTTCRNMDNRDERTRIGNSGQPMMIGSSNLGPKRRSNDRGASMALVCSSQGSNSDQRPTGTNTTGRQGGVGGTSSGGGNVISKAFLASDNERHKRKLAKARERRATLILGLIMATFICCWFPFFSFYVLRAVCHICRDYIPPRLEAFIFWMGYCNSAMNPIIYTIFNRDFRKAFRKILFRCSRD